MEQQPEAKRRRLIASCSTDTCAPGFKGLHACSTNTSAPQPKLSRFDHLPDDVRFNILVKVHTKCLHRSKSVSKLWLSFISAPSFARSYVLAHSSDDDDQHPNNKMLFLKIKRTGLYSIGQLCVLPHPDLDPFAFIPPLRPDNYVLNDDVCPKGVTERVLNDINMKGVSGGLVLLEGFFRDRTDTAQYYLNPIYFIYYVCNPVTKHWVELPQLPHVPQLPPLSLQLDHIDFIGFTSYYPRQVEGEGRDSRIWAHTNSYDNIIKHIADYDPNKIEFTVVHISRDENDDVFIIRVFSSTDVTAGWSIFFIPFPPGYRWLAYPRTKVLFFNGMFHWCGEGCIAVYDPFNKPMQCDLIHWPPTAPIDNLGEYMALDACEGRLRLCNSLVYDRFMAWELVDYANKVWVKKFDVTVDPWGLNFQSFVGGTARDKCYVVQLIDSSIRLFNVTNGSIQDFYEYPFDLNLNSDSLQYLEPFMSSPWPTSVPLRHRKLICNVDGV